MVQVVEIATVTQLGVDEWFVLMVGLEKGREVEDILERSDWEESRLECQMLNHLEWGKMSLP
jgi:hypothetical protein